MCSQDESAFLRSIYSNFKDDNAKLVYCDWLEENGFKLRADFIRGGIDLYSHLEAKSCRQCDDNGFIRGEIAIDPKTGKQSPIACTNCETLARYDDLFLPMSIMPADRCWLRESEEMAEATKARSVIRPDREPLLQVVRNKKKIQFQFFKGLPYTVRLIRPGMVPYPVSLEPIS